MVKKGMLLCCLVLWGISCLFAQEKTYFNQTELGVLIGTTPDQWSLENSRRVGFSLISFHGAKISKQQVLGFSAGLDRYDMLDIIPLASGWRGFLGQSQKPQLFGGVDLGGGFPLFEKREKTESFESGYRAGMLLSPSIGLKLPAKKGTTALTISLAYKRQEFGYFVGIYDLDLGRRPISNPNLPSKYSSLEETNYLYHSFVARLGFSF